MHLHDHPSGLRHPDIGPSANAVGGPFGSARSSGSTATVVGTVVRFTAGAEMVDVTIGQDSPHT